MTLDSWLHFGHILGATVWVGGGLMLSLLGSRARSSLDPRAVGEFARTLTYVGPSELAPAVIAVLVFGVWMVLESAAWDFTQLWVVIAIGLFVVAFLVGAIYLSRVSIQLQRAADEDVGADVGRRLLGRWIMGYRAVLIVLVVAVWDMVFKPGL
jgi:uncharacterized membrane protein